MASHARMIGELYRAFGHIVLRRATTLLGNAEDARDVLQQVFLALVKDPHRFRGDSSISTYLYRATTTVCLQLIRNGKTRSTLLATQVAPAQSEAIDATAETLAVVRQLVVDLPDDLAHVVIGQFVDGLTHEELADQLGCTRRHIGNLIEAARRTIQRRVA
jgi:RNA polymerase sigma-70 factor (ECF subfamily)